MSPKVSYIVPLYNKEEHVSSCIRSILEERAGESEILVIDDGSTDGSRAAVQALATDKRVILLENETNVGPGLSRNRALEVARGEFVRFVDADDSIVEGSTERLLQMQSSAKRPIVRGNINTFTKDARESVAQYMFVPEFSLIHFTEHEHLRVPWLFQACLYDRSFIVRASANFPGLRVGEDPVFHAQVLCAAGTLSTIAEPVYRYRTHRQFSVEYAARYSDFCLHTLLVRSIFQAHGYIGCANEYIQHGLLALSTMLQHGGLAEGDCQEIRRRMAELESSIVPLATHSDRTKGHAILQLKADDLIRRLSWLEWDEKLVVFENLAQYLGDEFIHEFAASCASSKS